MGYMGLGMNKVNYRREPRENFKNLKKILDKESTHYHEEEYAKSELTEDQKVKIKNKIEENRRKNLRKNILSGIIAVIGFILLVLLLKKFLHT